jgi:TRAP-type C4-dicarboxylate transport system substrate-binding protein
MRNLKTSEIDVPGAVRREFMLKNSKLALWALAKGSLPVGAALFEMTEAYAATEMEKKAKAEHVLLFSTTESANRWPNGKLSKEQSNLTGMIQLKQFIEEESKGRIYFDLQYGGTLGNQIEMPRKLQQGVLAGCHAATQNAAAAAGVWNVIDFPYIVGPVENFWKLIYSKRINDTLRKKSEEQGLITLCIFPQVRWLELRKGLNYVVRKPEDLKGVKMRVTGSKLEQTAFQILPANPTPVAWGEVYNALKDGTVDGIHVGPAPVADYSISEVVGTQTDVEFMYNSDAAFISTTWYKKLPQVLQGAVMEAAYRTQVMQHEVYESYLKDQWGIRADSPPDSLYKKLNINTVYLTQKERDVWKDFLSYDRNKAIYDPLIERFGKTEYEAVKSVANAAGAVEKRRWWQA